MKRLLLVLLCLVPPGLRARQILAWRANFRTSFAACYHPWLKLARRNDDDDRKAPVTVNPSAVAAGIIARRELESGIATGPANVIARGVVATSEDVSPRDHAQLHPLGINVFRHERSGVELTGARTLAADPRWRQLSVRRLMTALHRTIEAQSDWAVFEPNGPVLWAELRQALTQLLRRWYREGAFRGRSEAEAFFVRCDASLHPPRILDAGQLHAEVGVAPSEPLEFIVLQIVRGGDGTLSIAEPGQGQPVSRGGVALA